jgi:hypothetical protein
MEQSTSQSAEPPFSSAAKQVELNGFPSGYFMIRSLATERLLDLAQPDKAHDGSSIHLWPQKETSLVESVYYFISS